MRATVSRRLKEKALSQTIGKEKWETKIVKQQLKSEYNAAKHAKRINPVKESKRQKRLAAA